MQFVTCDYVRATDVRRHCPEKSRLRVISPAYKINMRIAPHVFLLSVRPSSNSGATRPMNGTVTPAPPLGVAAQGLPRRMPCFVGSVTLQLEIPGGPFVADDSHKWVRGFILAARQNPHFLPFLLPKRKTHRLTADPSSRDSHSSPGLAPAASCLGDRRTLSPQEQSLFFLASLLRGRGRGGFCLHTQGDRSSEVAASCPTCLTISAHASPGLRKLRLTHLLLDILLIGQSLNSFTVCQEPVSPPACLLVYLFTYCTFSDCSRQAHS